MNLITINKRINHNIIVQHIGFLTQFTLLSTFSVISSANATPEFEGRGGEELGVELSNTLYKVFNNSHSLDLSSLCICPGEHCWVLYVDVLVGNTALIQIGLQQ